MQIGNCIVVLLDFYDVLPYHIQKCGIFEVQGGHGTSFHDALCDPKLLLLELVENLDYRGPRAAFNRALCLIKCSFTASYSLFY